jgi:hypothetical protein
MIRSEWVPQLEKKKPSHIKVTCAGCGVDLYVWPCRARVQSHIYCGRDCPGHEIVGVEQGYKLVELPFEEDRFWRKVRINDQDSCWEWQAATNGTYPRYNKTSAHRYVEERTRGAMRRGEVVRHRCDNPICVNPDHLLRGTHADNHRDMEDRGRAFIPNPFVQFGVYHPRVLDFDKADQIRVRSHAGELHSDLAREYGVSTKAITRVVHGRTWVRKGEVGHFSGRNT